MKGRFYKPSFCSSPTLNLILPSFRQSDKDIKCIWEGSIPESWHKLSKKQNIKIKKLNLAGNLHKGFIEDQQKHNGYLASLVEEDKTQEFSKSPKLKKTLSSNLILSPLIEPKLGGSPELKTNVQRKLVSERNFSIQGKETGLIRFKRGSINSKEMMSENCYIKKSLKETSSKRLSDIFTAFDKRS